MKEKAMQELICLKKYIKEDEEYKSFLDFLKRGSLTYRERLMLSYAISRSCLEEIQKNFQLLKVNEISEPFPILKLLELLIGPREKSFWESETLEEDLTKSNFWKEIEEILKIIFSNIVFPKVKITEKILENPLEILKLISRGQINLVPYDDVFPTVMERFGSIRKERKRYRLLPTEPILSYLLKNPSEMPEEWKIDHSILFGVSRYVRGIYSFFIEIPSGYYYDILLFNSKTGKTRMEMLNTGFDQVGYVPVIGNGF